MQARQQPFEARGSADGGCALPWSVPWSVLAVAAAAGMAALPAAPLPSATGSRVHAVWRLMLLALSLCMVAALVLCVVGLSTSAFPHRPGPMTGKLH